MSSTIVSIRKNYIKAKDSSSFKVFLLKICTIPKPDIDCLGSKWTLYGYHSINILLNTKLMHKWKVENLFSL